MYYEAFIRVFCMQTSFLLQCVPKKCFWLLSPLLESVNESEGRYILKALY